MMAMHLEMMGSKETSMDRESLAIQALETTMVTVLLRRIALMVRSLVRQVSFHWGVPMETNRNSQGFEIAAKES